MTVGALNAELLRLKSPAITVLFERLLKQNLPLPFIL